MKNKFKKCRTIKTTDFTPNERSTDNDNDKYIKDAIEESEIIIVACCAAKGSRKKQRADDIVSLIKKYSEKKIYKTKKHPSLGSQRTPILLNHMISMTDS